MTSNSSRQLHKGQLRYHHFLPLQALHRARNLNTLNTSGYSVMRGTSGILHLGSLSTNAIQQNNMMTSQQQSRPFLTAMFRKVSGGLKMAQLKKLESLAASNPTNVDAQLQFMRALNASGEYNAVQTWYESFLAKKSSTSSNPATLAEYQSAMQRMGKNIPEHISASLAKGAGNASRAIGATALQTGSTATNPLYVSIPNSQAGNIGSGKPVGTVGPLIAKLVGNIAVAFIVVSFLGVLLDDKGLRGPGSPFGGSNTKIVQESSPEQNTISFDDVKGCDEAKEELEEVVEFLKNPSKFTRLGGTLPRGVLLMGPPGTGKTLLAKAVAGEAGVPFFYASGSQFEEMYVGVGAKRIRELFDAAKAKKSPCIIFIDEIDAVGGSRKLKDQSALKMTLNELLVQMDGFEKNSGIIVIGATNFSSSLDKALLRPGRFDKHVNVHVPDLKGRMEILQLYTRNKVLAPDVNLQTTARNTTGWSGAELYNLINTAALRAAVLDLQSISQETIEYARDKILMGAERKMTQNVESAACTAYHEAGHALVALLTPGSPPIHKATILPRGRALGMVQYLPRGDGKEDSTSLKFKEMIAYIDMAMGGRVAEELIFGPENISSGAMNDIQQATSIARDMVTKYGFSSEVGVVNLVVQDGQEGAASEATRAKVDTEVKKILDSAYERATKLLKDNASKHETLAEALIQYETLTGDEVKDIILNNKMPTRDELGNIIDKSSANVAEQKSSTRPRRFTARS